MFRVAIVAVILGTLGCSPAVRPASYENTQAAEIPDLAVGARDFWRAVIARDAQVIESFEPSRGAYVEDGKLREEIATWMNRADAIDALGDIEVVVATQSNGRAIVIFVPTHLRPRVTQIEFLQSEWMTSYFACEFQLIDDAWKLRGAFCFDETDGPYPAEY
jgi:hypothetical protein